MPHAGPADQTSGKDIVFVGITRLLNTVGRHQNRARKFGKFSGLILPGRTVVAVKVRIFFQLRITVRRQHLAMSVNIDAFPLGLPQELREVLQIMAGNEDSLSFFCTQWHFSRNGMAECCLLYTSDAADDLLCVDLGGRRIINKKKKNTKRSQ